MTSDQGPPGSHAVTTPASALSESDSESESEDRYRTLFRTIDEGFCVVELVRGADGEPADLIFREVNPAFARVAGIDPRRTYPGGCIGAV